MREDLEGETGPTTPDRIADAVESTDTDELLRIIDGFCQAREWDELLNLRHRCAEALTRGRQLWGVDEHIRYRLALEAPGSWAGPVIDEGPTQFTLGSLAETASSTKTWAELEPHIHLETARRTVAAERAVRGEMMPEGTDLELPRHLQHWEPSYPAPVFRSDRVDAPTPDLAEPKPIETAAAEIVDDPGGTAALESLVHPWITESNGVVSAVCVDGDGPSAVAALGAPQIEVAPLDGPTALAWMAWAASTGGAHGRRPGLAAGRAAAWFVVSELSDLDWPADPDQVGAGLERLRWWRWSAGGSETGWTIQIAADDPESGLAWALGAQDAL
ncbi:MAG: hypothetical protein GEU79_06920 [Acidimicrobiia bacterium]|nr:hypothetical protein [Acidimicrobiia bacterium]